MQRGGLAGFAFVLLDARAQARPAAGVIVRFATGVAPEGDLSTEDLCGLGRVVDADTHAVVSAGAE